MAGEDDMPILRFELRSQAEARLVGLPAKDLRVDRPHERVHAVEPIGRGAGRQPFEITVRARDKPVRTGGDVHDDIAALRHTITRRSERDGSPVPGRWDASATRTGPAGALAASACRMTWAGPTRPDPPRPCRLPTHATPDDVAVGVEHHR